MKIKLLPGRIIKKVKGFFTAKEKYKIIYKTKKRKS